MGNNGLEGEKADKGREKVKKSLASHCRGWRNSLEAQELLAPDLGESGRARRGEERDLTLRHRAARRESRRHGQPFRLDSLFGLRCLTLRGLEHEGLDRRDAESHEGRVYG